MPQLTGLRMTSGEKVTDYLTKAEGLKLDLAETGEVVSDAVFTAMILKGLSSEFDCGGSPQLRSLCFQRDIDDSISLSREEASKVLQVWKDGQPS